LQTIVLIHGYNLNATGKKGIQMRDGSPATYPLRDWETVCIGENGKKGRIPTALQLVKDFNSKRVIFSTGCTWTSSGESEAKVSEAWYTFRRAVAIAGKYNLTGDIFERKAIFDEESLTTSGTISVVAQWFREGRFGSESTYLMHVVSSNHSSRVLRDTVKGPFEDMPFVTHMFVPAETPYGGGYPKDTIVDDLGKSYCLKADVRNVAHGMFAPNLAVEFCEKLKL
jgi:hypothetical protein